MYLAACGGATRTVSGDALEYSCGVATLPLEALESTLPDEDVPAAAWAAIDEEISGREVELGLHGEEDWRAAAVSASEVTFLSDKLDPRSPYSYVTLERSPRSWTLGKAGGCRPSVVPPGDMVAAEWRLLDDSDEEDDDLLVEASEMSCSSGRHLAPDEFERRIRYESDRILVALFTQPVDGVATCIGNPYTTFTLALEQPVGDREVHDATFHPPHPE